ncbi:hypothetical protein ScPMuIL_013640 [Solemya velum]
MVHLQTAVILLVSISGAWCLCPDEETDLLEWSDESTWKNNKYPDSETDLVIERKILLNFPEVSVRSITVQNGGHLVWDPDVKTHLRTRYILIRDGGRVDIGSEECPYDGEATITLIGRRGDYSITNFDEKFIGVDAGGTLEYTA